METKTGITDETMDAVDECAGNSPIVKLTFRPPDTFVFSCPEVTMSATGIILILQDSDSAAWTFVGTDGLPKPEFETRVVGRGRVMIVKDAHMTAGRFDYTITVHDSTGNHSSRQPIVRPPMIMNL
jgi:hypothetical protein